MRTVAIAYLLGSLILFQLPELPDNRWSLLLLGLIPLSMWVVSVRFLLIMGCGFFMAAWHAHTIISNNLPVWAEGLDVVIVGHITTLPEYTSTGTRFNINIERIYVGNQPLGITGQVRLNWYGRPKSVLYGGDRWQLLVRLKHPHGMVNPGTFDYEAWLLQQHIIATGYVRESPDNFKLSQHYALSNWQHWRQSIASRLAENTTNLDFAGIITALAIGERVLVSDNQWSVFRHTGTNHLIAISGLHVGLVAAFGFVLTRRLWVSIPCLVIRLPAPSAAAIVAIILAIAYAALAGFTVPTQRAVIMITIVLLMMLMQRARRPSETLALALLAVMIFDPLALLSVGFWLSFAAVTIILFSMNNRDISTLARSQLWWWRWGRIHLIISLGLFPFLLIIFQQVPLVSPLANLIAVPWVSVLVVPFVLLGTLCLPLSDVLSQWLLSMADLSLSCLWPILTALASIDVLHWHQHKPPTWMLLIALIGVVFLLIPRGLPGRWLGLVWLAPAILCAPSRPGYGAINFTLLDVGQGLAAVVETQTHVLIYDTGPKYSSMFNTGDAVINPYLHIRGWGKIDRLVIGHGDNDHLGGADAVHQAFPILDTISSVPERLDWQNVQHCLDGQHWQWDGVDFTILHPTNSSVWVANNASCVLRISNGNHSILLTGDIEVLAENRLKADHPTQLQSTILVAPHHGSDTSSTLGFVNRVRPQHVLFPVGYMNRFQFPDHQVIQLYRAAGVKTWQTSDAGAIKVILEPGQAVSISGSRLESRHFWIRHQNYHP